MHTKQHYYFEEDVANLWATIFHIKMQFCFQRRRKRTWLILVNCIPITFFSLYWRFFLLLPVSIRSPNKNETDSQKWWNGKRFRKSIPSKFITRTVCVCVCVAFTNQLNLSSQMLSIKTFWPSFWLDIPNGRLFSKRLRFLSAIVLFRFVLYLLRICEWQHNWPYFALCRTKNAFTQRLRSGYNTLACAQSHVLWRENQCDEWHDQMQFNRIASNRIDSR